MVMLIFIIISSGYNIDFDAKFFTILRTIAPYLAMNIGKTLK